MLLRSAFVVAALLATAPAIAGEMKPEEARRFVVGKLFSFTCFDGTTGAGRIYSDGSVSGSIQLQGRGPIRWASLPAGTLRVKPDSVCANVRGIPFEPCFNLQKTSVRSFRGAVNGFGWAYCDFTRRGRVIEIASSEQPLSIHSVASAVPATTASVPAPAAAPTTAGADIAP